MNKSFFLKYSLLTVLVITLFLALIFEFIIPSVEKNFIEQRKRMICELINSEWHILLKLENDVKNGIMTREAAQKNAVEHIKITRYGDDFKEYFWIHDMAGKMIIHPYKTELIGHNIIEFQDPKGKFLVQEINKVARTSGAGFIEYMWQKNENSNIIAPKISYVKLFKPWNWVIGTGSYIYDIEEEVFLIKNKLMAISLIIIFIAAIIQAYLLFEHSRTEFARKKAEDTVLTQLNELTAKNAELEEFTYSISHDLKSPVITIKGYSELLLNYLKSGKFDRLENYIKKIESAILRMHQLLESLLALAKAGKIVNNYEEFSINDAVNVAAENLSAIIKTADAQIKIMPGMPSVFADRQRITEVFQNLIENAVKYSQNQPQPFVEIGFKDNGAAKYFFVKDSGCGIDKQYHEKIFKVFQKLDLKTEGCGIGLTIVKKIIESHNGKIWVESPGENCGTVFNFTIANIK